MPKEGNEIILALRTKFAARRVVETLRRIDVEALGRPIFYWPAMDMAEKIAIGRHIRMGADGQQTIADAFEMSLTQVLVRARDAFGDRLFADDNAEDLRYVDPDVIQEIANRMGHGDSVSLEDAEKN